MRQVCFPYKSVEKIEFLSINNRSPTLLVKNRAPEKKFAPGPQISLLGSALR
jgi:hypothetical protein